VTLAALLDPASVAIVGASDDPDKIGGRPLVHLARNGYAGRVLPVNPTRSEVQGLPCYPDVASLPEVPDVAIVAVPGDAAVRAVADLAGAGTQVAIVMSSGFSEVDEAGRAKEREMKAVANAAGMRMIGPNSMGTVNFATGAVLTFTTALLEVPRIDGPVAVISQSGSMAVEPYVLLARDGVGVRQVHATGNDGDVTIAELATLVAADPSIELLLLYLESVKDAAALAELGRVARERELPVIALKAGHTPAGQAAAVSHTGALASEDRVVDAFLERHGIWRARDLDDLVRTARLHLQPWRPRGNRFAVMSNSGAACVQIADAAAEWELELATLLPETRAALDEVLPGFATTTNPIDLTAAMIGNSHLFAKVLPPLVADPSVDAVHLALPIAGRGYDVEAFASDLRAVADERPVVVSSPMPAAVTEPFVTAGLPLFPTATEAVAALGSYLGQRRRMAAARAREHAPFLVRELAEPARMLDEAESMTVVATAGIPVVEHRLCRTRDDAVAAFRALGGEAVVVKGCSARISHKSDLGLVRLGLDDAGSVERAFDDVEAILRAHDPDAAGVLVARMARGRRELLLGARHDPTFGPLVVVGDGGIYVEAMPDVELLLAPFTVDDARTALARLRVAPVLAGARGERPMDAEAVVGAAVALGRLIANPTAGVVSVDLNPVFVADAGAGCVAADAVVFVSARD
jgi:acetate---CoA ligase (ADP-forming)